MFDPFYTILAVPMALYLVSFICEGLKPIVTKYSKPMAP